MCVCVPFGTLKFQWRKWAIKFSLALKVARIIIMWNKNPTYCQRNIWFSHIYLYWEKYWLVVFYFQKILVLVGIAPWVQTHSVQYSSSQLLPLCPGRLSGALRCITAFSSCPTVESASRQSSAHICIFWNKVVWLLHSSQGYWITINRIMTVSYQFTPPKKITIFWESQMTPWMVLTNDNVIYCNLQVYHFTLFVCFQITPELCCLNF